MGSISAVVAISVAVYVIYIQYKEGKRGPIAENGLQLSSISNDNLDSGVSYLNRGIQAFHEVSNEIIQNRAIKTV